MSDLFNPSSYSIIAQFFPRLLGFIYFIVFWAFLFQIKGLIGSNGILPVQHYLSLMKKTLGKRRFYYIPSIFWLKASDNALVAAVAIGIMVSLLLMLNLCPPVCLIVLYILQLSIVSTGQDFLGFGWEMFLLEITCNAFFLSLSPTPNPLIWISLNLLLFRVHFEGGASKIRSHDQTWRTLTTLAYHYQTQPLPNTFAWYAHHLPLWFHKLSAAWLFFVELIAPFGIFGPQEVRLIVFFCFFSLQFFIWLTGNYSYLNYLTAVLSSILISNTYLQPLLGSMPTPEPVHPLLSIFLYLAGAGLIFLQLACLRNYFKPSKILKKILQWTAPFHLTNRHGIFAVMTTKRIEVIIEGSSDEVHWHEYLFKFKPSEIQRRPRRVAPYQPRLDWMAWFLPFSRFESEEWFQRFLFQLLNGSPEVIKLLRYNPFQDQPPRYIRALLYEYQFSEPQLKKETGCWWTRRCIGNYTPILKSASKRCEMHPQ